MTRLSRFIGMAGLVALIATGVVAQQSDPGSQPPAARRDLPFSPADRAAHAARFKAWLQAAPNGSGPYGTVR